MQTSFETSRGSTTGFYCAIVKSSCLFDPCRFKNIPGGETTLYLKRLQTSPSFKGAILYSLSITLYHNQKNSQDLQYNICDETLLIIPTVMYVRKHFYLLESLNGKVEQMKAAGLTNFWHFQELNRQSLIGKASNYPVVLTLNRLMGCFEVYLFGCFISFTVFIFEVILIKLKQVCIQIIASVIVS